MANEQINIIDKISTLFTKYGIRSVTMDDVASELGISKKTLYQHVSDKADLIGKAIQHEFDKISERFAEIFSQEVNAIEQLLNLHRLAISLHKEYSPVIERDLKKYYPEIFYKILEHRQSQMIKYITRNMEKGIVEGLYRGDMNTDIISRLYMLKVESNFNNAMYDCTEYSHNEIIREIIIYHLRGICSRKGLDFLEQQLLEDNMKEL